MKIIGLFAIVFLNLVSCSSTKVQRETKKYIEKVTFQNWVGGIKGAGGGTIININLLKSIPENTQFIKIQFQNSEGNIIKLNDVSYQASIKTFDNESETISTPTIKTNLKPNQAKVFLKINSKESTIIIEDVKELPMLAYPSAKPINN
jgi:predicted lipase